MTTLADPAPARVTREQYFALVDHGVLTEDDHVELLEGVIVAMAPIYAAAGIREYWIANLRQDHVEVHRAPDPGARRYAVVELARRGSRLALVAFPDVSVAVDDLLP
jgi:Uma2 family endonuclease